MSKKNGKKVVFVILGAVFLMSLIAWIIQQRVNAQRGKSVRDATTEVDLIESMPEREQLS